MSDPKPKQPHPASIRNKMRKNRKWTKKEEEVIEFLMGLIPILLEAKADLESKNLLGPEFYFPGERPNNDKKK